MRYRHLLPIVILCFYACHPAKTFSSQSGVINDHDIQRIDIKIYKGKEVRVQSILQADSIRQFITALNQSRFNGPWKGAKWDQIILQKKDSSISFNSNGIVFGLQSSGIFYTLDPAYKRFWEMGE
jgi:hypothetical protein